MNFLDTFSIKADDELMQITLEARDPITYVQNIETYLDDIATTIGDESYLTTIEIIHTVEIATVTRVYSGGRYRMTGASTETVHPIILQFIHMSDLVQFKMKFL